MKRVSVRIILATSICIFGILGCTNSKSATSDSLSTSTTVSSASSLASTESKNSSSTVSSIPTKQTESSKANETELAKASLTKLHHPAYGTKERIDILDGMRSDIESVLGFKLIFEVNAINVKDGFAFVDAIPRHQSGAKIDYSKTDYRDLLERGWLDGGSDASAFVLLKHKDDYWVLLTYVIGPTDVAYADWWWRYSAPKEIFPSTE